MSEIKTITVMLGEVSGDYVYRNEILLIILDESMRKEDAQRKLSTWQM